MLDIAALATSAVAALTPLLSQALEQGAAAAGESAVNHVLDWFKTRVLPSGAEQALEDLRAAPQDEDNQADLRKQLKKALADHPALVSELADWLKQAQQVQAQWGATQHATVTGNGNQVFQIAGSGISIQR